MGAAASSSSQTPPPTRPPLALFAERCERLFDGQRCQLDRARVQSRIERDRITLRQRPPRFGDDARRQLMARVAEQVKEDFVKRGVGPSGDANDTTVRPAMVRVSTMRVPQQLWNITSHCQFLDNLTDADGQTLACQPVVAVKGVLDAHVASMRHWMQHTYWCLRNQASSEEAPDAEYVIDQLNVSQWSEEDVARHGHPVCCVTHEAVALGDIVCRLACGHVFLCEAVVTWIRNGGLSCPVCRFDLKQSTASVHTE